MSPTDDPLDPLDELASALVDGEPGADVEAPSPEVLARAEAFRRVAAAVAGDPSGGVEEERREQAIAAALAAWGTPAPAPVPVRDDLAARRAARARWVRPLGVAAAVVAAIAIGGAAIGGLGGGDDDDSGDQTAAIALDEESAEAGADSPTAADGGGSGAPVPYGGDLLSTADLGDFTSIDDLVALAEADPARSTGGVGSGSATAPPTTVAEGATDTDADAQATPAPITCSPPAGGVVFFVGTARLEGRPVEVYVIVADDGTRRAVVLDAADCSVIES